MASDSEIPPPPSLIARFMNSTTRHLSSPPPILGFTSTGDEPPRSPRDRIILINPSTQGMVVIEGSSASLNSLLRDLMSKGGDPPASKSSIEDMASVVIGESEVGECAICLDEWLKNEVVKEMPCKHRFHGRCVEKWLRMHGTCPVCRFKMPVDDKDGDGLRKGLGLGFGEERGGSGRGRREIWVSFSVNSERRRSENSDSDGNNTAVESTESIMVDDDHQME